MGCPFCARWSGASPGLGEVAAGCDFCASEGGGCKHADDLRFALCRPARDAVGHSVEELLQLCGRAGVGCGDRSPLWPCGEPV